MKDSTQKKVMHKKRDDLKGAKFIGKDKWKQGSNFIFNFKSWVNKKYETDQLWMGIKFGKDEIWKIEEEIQRIDKEVQSEILERDEKQYRPFEPPLIKKDELEFPLNILL